MISYTCSQNHSGFSRTSCVKSNRLRYWQIPASCDEMLSLKTFFVTRPSCLARRVWCWLQNLKFSIQYKVASKAIPSIKFILTFFDKKAIYHSTFSLTSWVHPQLLNRSRAFASFVLAATGWPRKFFQLVFSLSFCNCFLYIPSGLIGRWNAELFSNGSKIYLTCLGEGEMRVVWRLSRENGTWQIGVKGPRQRVAKGPVAEAVSAVGGPGGAGGTGEAAPAARGLEEVGGPGGTRGIKEPAPAAKDPRGGEKRGSQRGPGGAAKTEKPALAAGNPGGGETEEPALVAALLLSWSDYWQAFALAPACFRRCFSFFNRLFFSRESSLSSSLSLSVAITFLISPSSPQSVPVHSSQSLLCESY